MRRGIATVLLALLALACEPAVAPIQPIGETRIDCQGVPPQNCQQALTEARDQGTAPLVELIVRCSAPPCNVQGGQIDVQARYADGTTIVWGSGWGEAVPAPPPADGGFEDPGAELPVAPICIGVAESTCMEMARSAVEDLPPGSAPVVSITIRCRTVCLSTKAEGDSIVAFADGTTMTSGWAFETMDGGG